MADYEPFTMPVTMKMIREKALNLHGCEGVVTENFEEDGCGKPSVCLMEGKSDFFDEPYVWEACRFHAYRYGRGVVIPLAVVIEALNREPLREENRKGN